MSVRSNGPKGLHKDQRPHHSAQKTCPSQQSTSLEDHKRPLATSVQQRAERSQREAGRPGLVCFWATQATPTPGGNQGCPHKGGGQMPKILGHVDLLLQVIHSSASEPWIGCRFNRMDRKACTRIKGPTSQCKDMYKSTIQHPGIITSVKW